MHEEASQSYGTSTSVEKPWKLHSRRSQEEEGKRSYS
jgi:hypothetical protein